MGKLRVPLNFKETDLHRSVFDLGQANVSTFMQGLNIPVKFEKMKPKDEFVIDYASAIQSMPLVGQQFNDWKFRVMVFQSDLANYYSWMDNNARLTSDQLEHKRHHFITPFSWQDNTAYQTLAFDWIEKTYGIELEPSAIGVSIANYHFGSILLGVRTQANYPYNIKDFDEMGVQAGSLLDYLDFPVGFVTTGIYPGNTANANVATEYQSFCADKILCYLDATRNYLVNNQLDSVPYAVNLPNLVSESETMEYLPRIFNLNLSAIDAYLKYLRMQDDGCDLLWALQQAFSKQFMSQTDTESMFRWLTTLRFGGLFLAQYERDMLNNLLRTVNMEDVSITVDENGNFSINDFRLANRKQLLKDRFGISGGRWKNLLRTVWGVDDSSQMDIPILRHTSSYYLSARTLMSQSDTSSDDGNSGASLGQLGGVFNTSDLESKKTKVFATNHSILFAIVSLVPDVVYCNGLGKDLDVVSFDDEYYPQLDAIGFEDVPLYKYNALPYVDPASGNYDGNLARQYYGRVVGKNIAFIDMISNVNRCHGHFAKNAYFETWVLKRPFEKYVVDPDTGNEFEYPIPEVDITSYVNPYYYQYPFAVQSAIDHNFILQFDMELRAVRSKGKYFMPTLGK